LAAAPSLVYWELSFVGTQLKDRYWLHPAEMAGKEQSLSAMLRHQSGINTVVSVSA
jgi:hypothetical protein